jgi:hypothetical protein
MTGTVVAATRAAIPRKRRIMMAPLVLMMSADIGNK